MKGDNFTCPICKMNLKKFVPLPEQYYAGPNINNIQYFATDCETINIENYNCPKCGASDRERLYAAYFDLFADHIPIGSSLIHFAPESALSNYLRSQDKFKYLTADLLMENVDVKVDITNMSLLTDDMFDIFICSHILEHIENDMLAIKELHRILKPGGWGILMVPIITNIDISYEDPSKRTPEERKYYFGQEDHVRVYAKQDFINKVRNVGFNLDQLKENDFGSSIFKRYGITPKSVLYIVKK